MGLCSYSSETHSGSFLVIENTFINTYLPTAPDFCVKVYLYGLYLCSTPSSIENSLANMMHTLNLSASEIKDAFEYWQAEGLVEILENSNTNEFEFKYLPVHKKILNVKKYINKYASFNAKVQGILTKRMVTPNEYNEYYMLLENYHMDQDALLEIMNYCTSLKGENVGYAYIIAVAKNFANEGYKSTEAVKERLMEHAGSNDNTVDILKQFKPSTKQSTIEERSLYIKWTNELKFNHDVIKHVAKDVNKKGGNIQKLDKLLISYYNANLLTIAEIEEYNKTKQEYLSLAKDITRNLGTYYENLDIVIETYILDWLQKGYDYETLKTIAKFCFKRSTKTLEGMNSIILKFYKLGLISLISITEYIDNLAAQDAKIQQIFDKINCSKAVTSQDRDCYSTWINSWNFSEEIIALVANYSEGKVQPIQYMNKLLSNMFNAHITTTSGAEEYLSSFAKSAPTKNKQTIQHDFAQREYSQQDLNSLWDSLDDIEI